MAKVIWKDVIDYEGLYQVNNLGEVKSLFRYKKVLKPRISNSGYYRIEMFKNKIGKWHSVHRVVAKAFIPNIDVKPQVNHIDENKLNNNVENLEWVNIKENVSYGTRIKRMVDNTDYIKRKTKFSQVERTAKFEKAINQFDMNGNFLKQWKSATEYGKTTSLDSSSISKCCKGLRKTAHGYIWSFANERGNDLLVE